ncbi:hypothetical protein BPLS_P0190 [Bathymodiolus platifrons methanotrophic gill symbiont]|uniref:DUF1566 domain-containing protein n=1 Tax=Bathymodiolus platifrons methanotrophic gill symbiont TaxID=113268 RepID=UPI0011C8B26E|nr:DUF1566 domain-containing protein [Bathymodiolus platifrons methanotrophic gill symbiont]TXL21960.1 hypothetical protein BMR03_10990 [Methylococcaceae bacterium HT2]GFO73870.1 hypothetical protein BPLS_P0190 [Bathymodiolus platifrons methanotrophic gill symbiont]
MNILKLKKVVFVMVMILSGAVMAYGDAPENPGVPGGDIVIDIEEEKRLATIDANSEGVFMNSIGLKANRVAMEDLDELLPPIPQNITKPLVLTFCPNPDRLLWGDCPTYKVGGVGPAGGWVFSVSEGGIHGLEVAPEDQGDFEWGCQDIAFDGVTGTAIGTGAANTKLLAESDCVGKYSYSGEIAARVSNNYEINGFDDWYLPSRDELDLMSQNLKEKGLGGFDDGNYWSSSSYIIARSPNEFAWTQYFGSGQSSHGLSRFGEATVRSIRSF